MLALLIGVLTGVARAQAPAVAGAAMAGQVRGPGGTVVPGATVLATETRTGVRKETWSDTDGKYRLSALTPGTWRIAVSLIGFTTFVRNDITVAAGAVVSVDATLGFGAPAQPAGPAGAEGRRGGAGLERPRGQGGEGRNPAGARAGRAAGADGRSAVEPGAFAASPDDEQASGDAAVVRFADGTTETQPAAGANATGSDEESGGLDATRQDEAAANSFLLSGSVGQAATPGAGRGRFGGGRFDRGGGGAPGFGGGGGPGGGPGFGGGFGGGFFGRGGPRINRIRGSVSEQYANSAFDASPYALSGPQQPLLSSYNQRTGLTLGGPLSIPKIYDGSGRTTFFLNGSFGTSVNPIDRFATVPTAAERAGDFSGLATIYDPRTGQPFAGNAVPAGRVDPAAASLLQYLPLPNLPGSVNNYRLRETVPAQTLRLSGRVIQQLTARDSLNVAYNLQSSHATTFNSFPDLTSRSSNRGQSLAAGETHRFGGRAFNSFQFDFSQRRVSTLNPFAYASDVEGALGIQGASTAPINWGPPAVDFTNFTGLNLAIPSDVNNRTYRFTDSLLMVRGQHNLRIGGEFRRIDLDSVNDPDGRGTFTFTGFATSALNAAGLPVAGTGLDFADFLLGLPQATSVRFGSSSNQFRSWTASGFVEDDWRATSHVTFNLGLRYDYFEPFSEASGQLSNLVFGPGFSSVTRVTGLEPGSLPPSLVRGDRNNFSPRLAMAWRPSDEHSLVLRGGYGIFYDGGIYQRLVGNLASQAPFAVTGTSLSTAAQPLTLQDGLPAAAPGVVANTYAVDPNMRTPMAQTWSAGFEQSLFRYYLLSVSYVGTKGSNLDLLLGPNRFLSTGVNGSSDLSLAGAEQFIYETTGASSIYQGLQVELRRQFHDGFGFNAAYTFSKSLDNASSIGGAGQTVAQNPFDLSQEWGLSTFDVRHRLVANAFYRLPFGSGQRFLSNGGVLAALFGDWQVSGVGTYLSGNPLTATVLGNTGATGGVGTYFALRANATGLPVLVPVSTAQEFFNTAAFVVPVAGDLGNAGRGTIPGPSSFNVNLSVDRFITLSAERGLRLDVRLAVTNLLNTVNYTSVSTVVNAITFGQVTAVGPMRAMMLSLRMRF